MEYERIEKSFPVQGGGFSPKRLRAMLLGVDKRRKGQDDAEEEEDGGDYGAVPRAHARSDKAFVCPARIQITAVKIMPPRHWWEKLQTIFRSTSECTRRCIASRSDCEKNDLMWHNRGEQAYQRKNPLTIWSSSMVAS